MPAKGVAVVTGASYGLGASIAKQLACNVPKYEVVLVARWVSAKLQQNFNLFSGPRKSCASCSLRLPRRTGSPWWWRPTSQMLHQFKIFWTQLLKPFPRVSMSWWTMRPMSPPYTGPVGVTSCRANMETSNKLSRFVEGDTAEWEKMIGVNVWGALRCTR